ncbi:MAG: radical SAM protein [Acutalibacteraceae bacterium]|nr:radical SAM protein [Acutalibacteraceae bacterium]
MKHANIAVFVPHNGCPNQCSFCNQRTISGASKQPEPPDVALACEKAMQGGCEGADVQLAFFGGSFTAIDRGYMISLLEAAQPYIKSGFLSKGIRVSTRPDFIDGEVLSLLKEYGVRAIELGAQSMSDNVLTLNKRGHTASDVEKASKLIKSYGFELGLQMMTGLYGSDDDDSIDTAKQFISLAPDTVRIYPTVVLPGTLLAELYLSGEYKVPSLDESVELCSHLLEMFDEAGINVIRLGLHAQQDVCEEYLAGGYHPALRELCEGEIYYRKIKSALEDKPHGSYEIIVASAEISKAVGQKKKNISRLSDLGYKCKIKGDSRYKRYELTVERN